MDEKLEPTTDEDLFIDIYPCSCGHCTECGINFVPTEQELRDWEAEDNYGVTFGPWRRLI